MSVPEHPSLSRAPSTGLSRVLSRRRQLSDPQPWTPEPAIAPRVSTQEEEAADVELRRHGKLKFGLWASMAFLQLSVVSATISLVYLLQDIRGSGMQPLHLVWVVLSGTLCIALVATTWVLLRRRREHRRRAQEMAIARLSAHVDTLVQQNIELQISSRRLRDHGSTSSRRASPLGEEDFASLHRFQERSMDRQVMAWLDHMAAFDGLFENVRGESYADPSGEPARPPAIHNITAITTATPPLRTTRTA
ncbi:hypothetical protein GP486_002629 [Trichoglossum hirsutum]|uniref:Uncharacterized protein n=1 Tax=Trichoglossum hirsutum TaxID=265104 RepID=A0A9P8LEP4_9PEZI|nr:hypothetical protein GP486_002629 [Trichoglossum hirsutum]